MRMIVQGSGDVGGDFADLEIVIDEAFHAFDDLASGDDGAVNVLRFHPGVGEKRKHGFLERSEIAVAAFRTLAGTGDAAGFDRLRALIGHMFDFSVFCHDDGFERGGTDVDSQITVLVCHSAYILL